MVPYVELPPGMLSTSQLTPLPFTTVALKACGCPVATHTADGVTVTVMAAGIGLMVTAAVRAMEVSAAAAALTITILGELPLATIGAV
jgi:hypothetical protein